MKLLFFDTETTSLRPGSICQLSYITVDADQHPQVTKGHNFFFTVDEMSPGAQEIHGFSMEKLKELSEGKYFKDQYKNFLSDFMEADFAIGHNVNFDIKFMKSELLNVGEFYEPKNIFCTMRYYTPICNIIKPNGNVKSPKLSEVIDFLNVTEKEIGDTADKLFEGSGHYHDARFDTAATYLTVINGMKKGYIPAGYFSKLLK